MGSVSAIQYWGYRHTKPLPAFYLGIGELDTSTQAGKASTFSHWGISLAPNRWNFKDCVIPWDCQERRRWIGHSKASGCSRHRRKAAERLAGPAKQGSSTILKTPKVFVFPSGFIYYTLLVGANHCSHCSGKVFSSRKKRGLIQTPCTVQLFLCWNDIILKEVLCFILLVKKTSFFNDFIHSPWDYSVFTLLTNGRVLIMACCFLFRDWQTRSLVFISPGNLIFVEAKQCFYWKNFRSWSRLLYIPLQYSWHQ